MDAELRKELDAIKKDIKIINLWQNKIIDEMDSVSSKHAYFSSFSCDAQNELEKEHPDLFPKEKYRRDED